MKKITDVQGTLDRLKSFLVIGTDKELREALGIARPTMDLWKKQEYIPPNKIMAFCKKENAPFEWFAYKEGIKPSPKLDDLNTTAKLLTPELVEQLSKVAESMPIYGKDKLTKTLCKKFDGLDDVKKRAIYEKLIAIIDNV